MFATSIRDTTRSRTAITKRMIFTALVTVRILCASCCELLIVSIAGLIAFGLPLGPGGTIAA